MPLDYPMVAGLKVRPLINACGVYTDLGGSRLSRGVIRALYDANQSFVSLPELLSVTGAAIAQSLGVPAACVTPGAAAGIMLGSAACMAGRSGAKSQQLPATTGMPDKVLIQTGHRYKYDRQVSLSGAQLIEVGNVEAFTQALSKDCAMVLHPAHLDGTPGTLALEEVAELAREANVPVFVDAAYMVYPVSLMSSYWQRGADITAISAKYYGGPNAGGFLLGREDLIAAIDTVHFTRYESGDYLKFGRVLKMDRQIVVAVHAALQEWLALDHSQRLREYHDRAERLVEKLSSAPHLSLQLKLFTMDERFVDGDVNSVLIEIDSAAPLNADELCGLLSAENPSIACIDVAPNQFAVVTDLLTDDEVDYVAERIVANLRPRV